MLYALLVLVILAGGTALLGASRRARLRSAYPPPGRLIDLGEFRLHLQESGQGGPVVVIDAGLGDFSLTWSDVLRQAAEFCRVCTYDRAGLGWSEPSPRPRTAAVIVDELQALLDRAGLPAPYVLVGASSGGLHMRLFAQRHPEQVAGLVLVDAAHEDQFSDPAVRQTVERMRRMMPLLYGGLQILVRSGLAALRPSILPDTAGLAARLSRADLETCRAVIARDPAHLATTAAELAALEETHQQLRAAGPANLGNLPLVVLRHGASQPMMASPEVARALEATSARLQEQLAGMSTAGRLVVAQQSGHAIHLEQPELVVQAIHDVVQAARLQRARPESATAAAAPR